MSVEEYTAAFLAALQSIAASLANIANSLVKPSAPTRIILGPPLTIRNGKIMANTITLPNDAVQYWPIFVTNMAGVIEPAISGDTYSVTMGAPTSQSGTGAPLNAVIGTVPAMVNGVVPPNAGAVAIVLNALNQLAAGILLTVSDTSGLMAFTAIVGIVADSTPANIILGPVVTTLQPVPAA